MILTTAIDALFWMLIGHAVADYPLQGDFLAKLKNHKLNVIPEPDAWEIGLLAHCAIHAGAVKLATGSWFLALCEFVAHCGIDYSKSEGRIGFAEDQLAHISCKVLWTWMLIFSMWINS